jgi:hypothetical protein
VSSPSSPLPPAAAFCGEIHDAAKAGDMKKIQALFHEHGGRVMGDFLPASLMFRPYGGESVAEVLPAIGIFPITVAQFPLSAVAVAHTPSADVAKRQKSRL